MEKSNNIPALRFSEFTEKWKVKKLGKICDIIGGGTPETNKEAYWNGNIQWFTPTEIKYNFVSKSNRTITELGLKKSSAKLLPKGAILLTTRATIGEVSIALEICATNQGFQSLIVKENTNNIFIFNWLKQNKNELLKKATGSTFPEISKSKLEELDILIPTLPEQQKIADFFTAIDDKLFQLKQKKNLLEQYKKGMMQKIFAQKLRFKKNEIENFSNWDKKILDEVTLIKSGLAKEQNLNQEGIKVTRIETISHGVIDLEKVGYVIPPINIATYKLNKGDILFSNINSVSHIGKTAIVKKDLDLYHGMNLLCLKSFENIYALFLFYFLNTNYIKTYFQSICNQAISQASINQTELGKTLIMLPCFEEQKKIADFLSSIDDKITITETQIKKMENWKKGLLQQMFV